MTDSKKDVGQLPLPLDEAPRRPRNALRLIRGEGQRRQESLSSRDAVARVLVEAAADLLLRRISSQRAHAIEKMVEEVLALFDRVDTRPDQMPHLERKLDALETLMKETRDRRRRF